MDSGAQRSIICIRQARLYTKHTNFTLELSPSGQHYKFGDNRTQGLGKLVVRMPVTDSNMVDVTAEVVNVDVNFLLGIDVMTRLNMGIEFSQDTVRYKTGG